jgi:hypothetical protein
VSLLAIDATRQGQKKNYMDSNSIITILSTLASIAQVISVIWILLVGSASIPQYLKERKIRLSRKMKVSLLLAATIFLMSLSWVIVRSFSPTVQGIPSFADNNGGPIYVGNAFGKKMFFDFLKGHERQVVRIDVSLSEEQAREVESLGKGIFYIELVYKDQQGFDTGGELHIDLSQGEKDFVFDSRPFSYRVQSYLKIDAVVGPQMGIFTVLASPVSIENVPKAIGSENYQDFMPF